MIDLIESVIDLRHYGAVNYRPELFKPIENRIGRNKPRGGLWTSPVDSGWGWKDWAEMEEFGDLSTYFDLVFYGRVMVIDGVDDLMRLPWDGRGVLFDRLGGCGVDAIHLTERGEKETRLTSPYDFYGWDCETVLIMNQDAIRVDDHG